MKPEDIPQEIWDKSWNVEVIADFSFDGQTGGNREQAETAENIARAIMAAVAEERQACADRILSQRYVPLDMRTQLVSAIRNRSNT